jgi:hypothetical protein
MQRLIAVGLGALLISCGATRSTAPNSAEALTRFVLVISERPDGQVLHAWHRAEEFDLSRYRYGPGTEGLAGRIVLTSSQQPDCYAQYLECYHQCRKTPVPPDFEHYLYDFGPVAGHERYCSETCMRRYTECMKAQGRRPQEFTAVDHAVDWLKRNHKAVLVGSMVVIAGVAFVVVSAGAGVVVLAPAALVVSP